MNDPRRADGAVPRRARTSRAVENDERILDAAICLVVSQGVDRLSLRDVAAAVELTHGALYSRYDNVAELLVDLWQRRLSGEVTQLVAAAAATGTSIPAADDPVWMCEPLSAQRAAVELCLVAERIDELAEVIPRDLERALALHGLIGPDIAPDAVGIGHFCALLGRTIVSPAHGFRPADVTVAAKWLARGLDPGFDGPPPEPWPPRPISFETGDAARDTVLLACASVVARSGMIRATLKRIGRAAGCVPSTIYAWYDSREELMYDVVRQGIQFATVPVGEVVFGGVDAGPSLAAGWADPAARVRRRLPLEMYLAAMHDSRLATVLDQVLSEQLVKVAVGLGLTVPDEQRLALVMLRHGNVIASGVSALADMVPGLHQVDWRPYSGAILRGAFRAAAPERREPAVP